MGYMSRRGGADGRGRHRGGAFRGSVGRDCNRDSISKVSHWDLFSCCVVRFFVFGAVKATVKGCAVDDGGGCAVKVRLSRSTNFRAGHDDDDGRNLCRGPSLVLCLYLGGQSEGAFDRRPLPHQTVRQRGLPRPRR